MLGSFDTTGTEERHRDMVYFEETGIILLPRACTFKKNLISQERTGKDLLVKINLVLKMIFFPTLYLVLFLPRTLS